MSTEFKGSVGPMGTSLGLIATPEFGRVALEIVWGGANGVFELKSPAGAVLASITATTPGVYQMGAWSDFPTCMAFGTATASADCTARLYYKRGF